MGWRGDGFAWLVVAEIAGVACGGTLEPIQVADTCPQRPIRGPAEWASAPDDQLISDFEEGTGQLAQVAGRSGSWIMGQEDYGEFYARVSSRCAARGKWAGHMWGEGFTDWGANWTAIFRPTIDGVAAAYDARSYNGISFWGAVGGRVAEPLHVPVGLTTMDVAWNGGVCDNTAGECMDFFRQTVALTRTWQRFEVRFSDLKQTGRGFQSTMTLNKLVGFIIYPRPDHPFDIWIDDVRFEP